MKTIKVKEWDEIPVNFTGIAEWPDGTKKWFLNGKRHRLDGPTSEFPSGEKQWWLNGERHRTDGPAIEAYDGTKHYWIHDKFIKDETAFKLMASMMKLKKNSVLPD